MSKKSSGQWNPTWMDTECCQETALNTKAPYKKPPMRPHGFSSVFCFSASTPPQSSLPVSKTPPYLGSYWNLCSYVSINFALQTWWIAVCLVWNSIGTIVYLDYLDLISWAIFEMWVRVQIVGQGELKLHSVKPVPSGVLRWPTVPDLGEWSPTSSVPWMCKQNI